MVRFNQTKFYYDETFDFYDKNEFRLDQNYQK